MRTDLFALRHIGINEDNYQHMLKTVGVENLDQLIHETIPNDIKLKKNLDLPEALSENEYLEHLQELADKNKVFKFGPVFY